MLPVGGLLRLGKRTRTRQGFGWVCELPSGRHQASYLDPTGTRFTAKAVAGGKVVPLTFLDRKTTQAWLLFNLRRPNSLRTGEGRYGPPAR